MNEKKSSSRSKRNRDQGLRWTFSCDLKSWFWILWLLGTVAFATWSWVGENSFQQVWKLRSLRKALERENQILQNENGQLINEIMLIERNPEFLEWIARERLGMIGKDEWLYVFSD